GGGVLSLDRHREIDDATHRGLGDDDVVEGGVLPEPLAVPHDADGQHHALVHRHPACEQRLEGWEHLLERRRGEEAEPAEVHAQQGNAKVADRPRHGQEGPVAAEDDEQVRVRGQLRLGHGGDARRRDQHGGLLHEHRGKPPRPEPLAEPLATASRPTSNCGFTSAMTSPRGASTPNTEGRIFSSEINATSMTASVGCSPKIRGSSARALVFSMTTTRGSLRSLASSWPTPTSTA